jgi:murein DD-endopeptidase MepM/ murein hydrolase activator NlpD
LGGAEDSALSAPERLAARARAAGWIALVLVAATCGGATHASRKRTTGTGAADSAPFAPALASPPLAGALEVAGGFCEYRQGHFHAGFDLSTGRRVGRPVLAPLPGSIERVRASGVGYGRSIYLRADDGRLLVFGHLDAYVEPLASYVRAAQESAGVYEQDLWPAAGRFRFRAGETLAWSGESGSGGPHLHFEIRRGDMAYHPQRAGLAVRDTAPPSLTQLTLEPLDADSWVAGSAGPQTFRLDHPETLDVIGRVRAVVGARDGIWSGVDRMVPWETGMEWAGERVMCRFDSVSWATDMAEGDLVYDAGRVLNSKGIVLWARAGFRPRALITDAALATEAGTIHVRSGDPPRRLTLWARDVSGGRCERQVWLRPSRDGHSSEAATPNQQPGGPFGDAPLVFAALPGGAVRLTLPAPRGNGEVRFAWGVHSHCAIRDDDGWSAVFRAEARDSDGVEVAWRSCASGSPGVRRGVVQAWHGSPAQPLELRERSGARSVRLPAGALFEDATLVAFAIPLQPAGELEPLGDAWRVEPEELPLARAVTVSVPVPPGTTLRGVGLYRRSGGAWQWLGAADDSTARALSATTRQLGAFALFRDTRAPRASRFTVARDSSALPYSRWALEATLDENGSGVSARDSWIEVDGHRLPTEWDPEAGCLRWRPATPPASGGHHARIVAADHAGNVTSHAEEFSVQR